MQPGQLDFDHRIGNTFVFFFKLRYDDGTLRSFSGASVLFTAISGATTVTGTVVFSTVEGTTNAGILVTIPASTTAGWKDGQTFWYQLDEIVGSARLTLMEGNIKASKGVV